MKIILSRKGFDSASGGVPSPILTDGSPVSLPIPDQRQKLPYIEIAHGSGKIGPMVEQLTKGKISQHQGAHLDPDLNPYSLPRAPGWRPAFGQYGAAQAHLANQGVGVGDLFLFFGLFRQAMATEQGWQWVKDTKPHHRFWGYLQVGDVIAAQQCDGVTYPWLRYHPHCQFDAPHNTLYLAADDFTLANTQASPNAKVLPGAGYFASATDDLRLTDIDAQRVSQWRLPRWFHPGKTKPALSYHNDAKRWQRKRDHTRLDAVARGQEFVLDCKHYRSAQAWALGIINKGLSEAGDHP
ncbi:hypothetical protein [Halioxenophilus aromaticivorans]|uniref:Nucleotide modification associated domain-containing protein n=1 Tax=Halioxenophilus aromaticivorans TaxID=1306992 RepID=A0AAV3U402_9ALTE